MIKNQNLDTSKSNKDAALLELYAILTARNAPKPGSFTSLAPDDRREYYRVARQRSRARHHADDVAGNISPNLSNVRQALADAALMILATDAPGADQVRAVLMRVFQARPGVPLTVEQRARAGKLRPKMIGTVK